MPPFLVDLVFHISIKPSLQHFQFCRVGLSLGILYLSILLNRRSRNPAKETVLISDVIKAMFNSALVKSDVLPLAESVVISVESDLELYAEPIINFTDFSSVDFSQEQQKDPDITRFYHILNNKVILNQQEIIKQESKAVQFI
jgi:hypothetical protein